MFKIEGYNNGQWDSAAVGHPDDNTFETREEAEAQIPALAKIFDCPETALRVVEN